ncbi:hypothetical protein [Blastococcus saxobsidens]|uniref:Integral membrane protein n=1 Tax=Blastococcus saxobsidens TaxID=138336 RepID=A0A4Q7Y7A2_9ACTN|nr:hypothetical protein [Blastococcus saxobsidens]RZU32434.1 hypothetical protein BKA19_2129 [Blastococcus saxobsidens]
MLNSFFVTVHATAATVAFAAGIASVARGRFLAVYRAAVLLMAAALVPAVLVDWSVTDPVARGVFGGLVLLAGAVVVRAELAVRGRPARPGGPSEAYLRHLGFTLVALADGFLVVAVIRGGAPPWLVVVTAVSVVVAGHAAVGVAVRRIAVLPVRPRTGRDAVHPNG